MLLLHLEQLGQGGLDGLNLLLGGMAVVAEGGDAGIHLGLQGGHPHHEEFIEVVAEDGAELRLLQQGGVFVERLRQHPVVEGDPAQLPVDIELGIHERCSVGIGHKGEGSNLSLRSLVLGVLDRAGRPPPKRQRLRAG